MKPYHQVLILECGEPLVPIPLQIFAIESPHPYEKLGANYEGRSPYYLRQSVINSLLQAQNQLQQLRPDWRIQIFDAYRPVTVQQFMVDYTFAEAVQAAGLREAELSEKQRQTIWQQVYELWAVPSLDENTPPPHSTGAAVDVTLVDSSGQTVNMGSPIDELSQRSHPDYFANSSDPEQLQYHSHRQLLRDIMLKAGFQRHPGEWWHFCLGDQMWAWLSNQGEARYGRIM
jgi:D-alanyl-D-alanine dipeptidase